MDNSSSIRHPNKISQDGLGLKFVNEMTSIDFVGKKAELLIGSKRRVKTFLGGLLSFLIFALILIGFLYFGQEIVFKQIPSVVLSSIIDDGSKPILIDKDNFNFLITLKDSGTGNYLDLDSDFIDVKISKVILSKQNSKIGNENSNEEISINKSNMDLVHCDKVFGYSNNNNAINRENERNKTLVFESLVNNLNKANYKCLAAKAQISGSAETNILSYLEISINSCLDLFEFLADATQQDIRIVTEKVFKYQSDILIFNSNNTANSSTNGNNNIENKNTNTHSPKINLVQLKKIFEIKTDYLQESNFEEVLAKRKICPFNNQSGNLTEILAAVVNKNSSYSKNKSLINNALFVFKYIETYFDVRSFSSLANYVIEEYKSKFNTNQIKKADLNLKKIEYFTDKGLILEDFEITSYTQLTKISETYESLFYPGSYSKSYLDPLLTLRLNADKIREVFYRKYYKAQNLIAELGGLLKSFFTVALILNYFNNHAKYYEKMIDELFDVDDLYKYYQFYNSKNKTIFKKYRDSILLRNTKNMDNFKKNIVDKHAHSSNHFMKTRINHSKDMLEGSLGNLEILNRPNKNNQNRDNFHLSQKLSIENNNKNIMKQMNLYNENVAEAKPINEAANNHLRIKEFETQNNNYKNLKEEREKEQLESQFAPNCIEIESSIHLANLQNNPNSKYHQTNKATNQINLHLINQPSNNNELNNNIHNFHLESQNQIQNELILTGDNNNRINNKTVALNDYFFNQNEAVNAVISNENSFSDSDSDSEANRAIIRLRKNEKIKENFYKLKKKRFALNMVEMIKFNCCWKSEKTMRKKQILSGGKSMINQKLDVIHILKKNLEFDRFKNLMLRDYQLVLLNSLSKFMLDPEKLNLVDFHNCNYDKFIDSYAEALNSQSIINFNLVKLIDNKFQIDKF